MTSFSILLVEDDSNDAVLLQRALRRANVQCPVVHLLDGDDAIRYIGGTGEFSDREKFPFPSLILLDLKLPRKPGLEFLAWLRTQGDTAKDLPVIVLTSSRQTADIDQAYALGATSYLAKPDGSFEGLADLVRGVDARLSETP